MTTDRDDAPKQFTGGVNIAQRLCYNSSSMLFKRKIYDQTCSDAYGSNDWKEMWSPNNLLTYKLCSATSAGGDMILIMLPLIQQALKSQAIVQAVTPIIDICCQVTVTVLQ